MELSSLNLVLRLSQKVARPEKGILSAIPQPKEADKMPYVHI